MLKELKALFSKPKTENNKDGMKPEVHEHQKNNIKSVSNKFLIVGLGNIGAEYVNTRHNIGFKILDYFARKEGINFETVKLGALAEYKFKGRTFLLLKPNT
jgi:PTH1 family peptidyl-tRNA hydrolase